MTDKQAEQLKAAEATLRNSIGALSGAIDLGDARQSDIEANLTAAKQTRQSVTTFADGLGAVAAAGAAKATSDALKNSIDALKAGTDLVNAASITGKIGSTLDEWKECRATIDRCDKLLVDVRKTGFGFVTAVVGASAFVFGGTDNATGNYDAKVSIFCMLVLLIVAIYVVDLTHQSWLKTAVGRAHTLEASLKFHLTQEISKNFAARWAVLLGYTLYLVLLLATGVIFWFSIPLKAEGLASSHREVIYAAFVAGWLAMSAGTVISDPNRMETTGLCAASSLAVAALGFVAFHLLA
jgi:hypothetical protein